MSGVAKLAKGTKKSLILGFAAEADHPKGQIVLIQVN
jgi:hypothetical protein